ncbi:hypothetical protein BKI52_35815 [marine bacterium AO1-C]|nr:hypothetical protein BKI52_35815 [marine bacterium AO1-C]
MDYQASIDVQGISAPFLQHELILNLGDTFIVNDDQGQNGVILSLMSTKALHTQVKGLYKALGIIFSPLGIYQTYGISPKELVHPNAIDQYFFDHTTEFLQIVEASYNSCLPLDEIIHFFKRNASCNPLPPIISNFLKAVQKHLYQPIEIQKITQELSFGVKHLIATFKDVVGLTPHKYLQLIQLNQAIHMMKLFPDRKLTQIALENGFYDQSHFIRVFKKNTGFSPRIFRKQQISQSHNYPNTIIL